ncbi:DUF7109 family protein [Natrarchaeobius oligotrophus]|uniref:Uncharacterized protein n=1 Tax=Natrarchaeobius chitinivorans TaxID=1679083 RepID=A0A3N6PNC2_NATCH|nr:hypothetical protein [Natrarchaeobius chitinivorans]RQH03210.1 hypothetical protein EA472_01085 [Natrarchaeobius chitinivorans]
MNVTADELAGVVDLFGGLTRPELERALSEAAFRADGSSVDGAALEDAIEDAIAEFALVRYERDGTALLVPGPTAFPTVPDHAEDVPHILEIDRRRLDRDRLGKSTAERFVEAVDAALDGGGTDERLRQLLDVSYDVEAWAPVELTDERRRLEARLE